MPNASEQRPSCCCWECRSHTQETQMEAFNSHCCSHCCWLSVVALTPLAVRYPEGGYPG